MPESLTAAAVGDAGEQLHLPAAAGAVPDGVKRACRAAAQAALTQQLNVCVLGTPVAIVFVALGVGVGENAVLPCDRGSHGVKIGSCGGQAQGGSTLVLRSRPGSRTANRDLGPLAEAAKLKLEGKVVANFCAAGKW